MNNFTFIACSVCVCLYVCVIVAGKLELSHDLPQEGAEVPVILAASAFFSDFLNISIMYETCWI